MISSFEYTPRNLAELEIRLSFDRLQPSRTSVGGERERAIRLYEQNTLLAESLYGVLQGLEIALRNSIHAQLTASLVLQLYLAQLKENPQMSGPIGRVSLLSLRELKPPAPSGISELQL
jgi:hypothetical protein